MFLIDYSSFIFGIASTVAVMLIVAMIALIIVTHPSRRPTLPAHRLAPPPPPAAPVHLVPRRSVDGRARDLSRVSM